MIITTKRHGRSRRDLRNLIHHLDKQTGQSSRVIAVGNVPLSHANDAIRYMEALRDASRATVSCHHITISPRIQLTEAQRDEAIARILKAMGAEKHAFVVWQHSEKSRTDVDTSDEHFHLVIAHIGPDGRALSDSWSFVRTEAVARCLEVDFGEPITHSRRTRSVAAELRRFGRSDVADMLVSPTAPPASAMSSQTRARAERAGLNLPEAQAAVRAAWKSSDNVPALLDALRNDGFKVIPGKKPDVFIVEAAGKVVGALDRIVREKRGVVAARMKKGGLNAGQSQEAEVTRRSHLPGSPWSQEDVGAAAAASGALVGRRDSGWQPPRRIEGSSGSDSRGLASSERNPPSARRRIREQFAIRAIERVDLSELRLAASAMAAGGGSTHSNRGTHWGGDMTDVSNDKRKLDYKTKLLAEVAPQDFDALAFASDLRMIQVPSLSEPTTKILLNDGGWVEIDRQSQIVRFWGALGRARALASALAEAGGWQLVGLKRTATVVRKASLRRADTTIHRGSEASLVAWWKERGYVASVAPDGVWVHVSGGRIRDKGDFMEIYGPVSREIAVAVVTKAQQAWGGGLYLDGDWTQMDMDMVWLEAQRQGVRVENCNPSNVALDLWRKEQAKTVRRAETMVRVRSAVQEAADLLAAARGSRDVLDRLPEGLRAFVASYLDDDQRAELAASDVVHVIPELRRFRQLGEAELARTKRNGMELPSLVPETPSEPDNSLTPAPI